MGLCDAGRYVYHVCPGKKPFFLPCRLLMRLCTYCQISHLLRVVLGPFEIATDSGKIARDSGYGDKPICDPGQEVCATVCLIFIVFIFPALA